MSGLFNDFYKNKKILITGHTGFKGSWFSLWLCRLGAEVIGYALEPPTEPSLFEICGLSKKLTSVISDIRQFDRLKDVLDKYQPEIVFHMAAQSLVRYSYKKPTMTYETNVMGTVNLLEACRHIPSVRVIANITSDKCYENHGEEKRYKESDPMGGHDPYSSSKGCSELVTNAYLKSFFNIDRNNKKNSVSLASVRSGNVIGGGDWAEDRFVPDCIKAFIKNKRVIIRYPDAIRPWQHVLEGLYGYLLLAKCLYQNGPAFSGPWNFGPNDADAKPVKWLVERLVELWGKENIAWTVDAGKNPHEALYLKLDSSKARTKLGWYPQWGLQTALTKTVECYKAYYNNEDMAEVILRQIGDYEAEARKAKVKCNDLQVL
ncbi:MAG: CDP-glucose 4,6-dehydratase [Candidatus Omnitrophica bacterium]|nr:CDP-glucose 4,6-dehydratase [Candidatus Omnitrophota bacterium]